MSSSVRSPYRTPAAPPSDTGSTAHEAPAPDEDLWPVLAAMWVASAVRVAGALWMHQVFGAEATLALAMLLLGPCLVRHRLGARLPARRGPSRG
jgi:hypothetical protein